MVAVRRNPNSHHLLLLLAGLLLISVASAAFSPADNYLLSCGSSIPVTTSDRREFLPDSLSGHRHHPPLLNPSPSASSSAPLDAAARIFSRPTSYSFKITKKGTHFIRLHFYPFQNPSFNLADAVFHVIAADNVLLANFRTSRDVLKEYLVNLVGDSLTITFAPAENSKFGFINAIEVVSAPDNLILDLGRLVYADKIENFHGLEKQAMETMYRLNVGGLLVTPFNDTLSRTWVPDTGFVKVQSVSSTVHYGGRLKYQTYGASREVAPDYIYDTARVIQDAKVNMTWEFPVVSGYKYLVRMHFCDIASKALNEIFFNVYINGLLAYENFDVSSQNGVLAAPYYVDFVVDVQDFELMSVSIVPLQQAIHSDVKGLLNGLEIMKMNNSISSLDGKVPIVLVTENLLKRGFGSFLRSIACGFAFISIVAVAFMMFLRWRAESRALRAWSRLPTDISDGYFTKESQIVSGKLTSF